LKQFTALSAFLTAAYLRLPGQMRGMLLLFCATILFSVMHALIRHVGEGQHPFEMAFFRNLFGFIVLAPFFLRYGFGILRTQRLGLHALRGSIHVGSMMLFFSAVTIAPLATVAAMTFTAPLFVTLGAVFLLGEQIRYRRMGALFLGFAGVMIVLRPGFGELEVGALMALGSSGIWACAMLMIKILSRTESSLTLTAYMAIFLTPLSAIPAAFVWQWPSVEELGWLAVFRHPGRLRVAMAKRRRAGLARRDGHRGHRGSSFSGASLPRGRRNDGTAARFSAPDLGQSARLLPVWPSAGGAGVGRRRGDLLEHDLSRLPRSRGLTPRPQSARPAGCRRGESD